MVKIGAITVGQSPRVDVTPDLWDILGDDVELIEGGGLDGLTREEIQSFAPQEGDDVLVSRLNDGSSAVFAERFVLPRIQAQIERMQREGVKLIMMFCTGVFPDSIHAEVPLIYPNRLLEQVVPILSQKSHLIIVTPSPLQVSQVQDKWKCFADQVDVVTASPYGDMDGITAAAEKAADLDGDIIVLDCIGFSLEMKRVFTSVTGKFVILPRTLLARIVRELL